jgi:hypothetical protein
MGLFVQGVQLNTEPAQQLHCCLPTGDRDHSAALSPALKKIMPFGGGGGGV